MKGFIKCALVAVTAIAVLIPGIAFAEFPEKPITMTTIRVHSIKRFILNVDLEVHEIYNRAEAQEYVRSRMQSENPI